MSPVRLAGSGSLRTTSGRLGLLVGGAFGQTWPAQSSTGVIDYGPTTALGSRTYQAGDVPEPSYSRTYALPSLPTDGTTAINSAWAACLGTNGTAVDGDCVTIPAGSYVANGNLDVRKNGVTIKATGAVTVTHKDTSNHGVRIYGKRCQLRGSSNTARLEFKTTGVSGRGDQNEQGMSTLHLAPGSEDFVAQDVTLRGAKAAGFFAYNSVRYLLNRVRSIDSLADAYHNTNGCRYGMFIDCYSRNAGDDLMAFVHYDPRDKPSQVSTDMTVIRHRGYGNNHGRGFAVINCRNIYAEDVYYERTGAAGIIIGREYATGSTNYQPQPVENVTIKRGVLWRCNQNEQDHGAIFLTNGNGDQASYIDESSGSSSVTTAAMMKVRTVALTDIKIIDTNYGRAGGHSGQAVRGVVYSGGTIQADLTTFTFYGDNFYNGSQANAYGGNVDSNSSIVRTGWTYPTSTWDNTPWADPYPDPYVPPPTVSDISDTFTGSNGAAVDSSKWTTSASTTGSTITIQNNQARLLTGTDGNYASWARLISTSPSNRTDTRVQVDVTPATTDEAYFNIWLRAATNDNTIAANDAYRLEIPASSGVVFISRLGKYDLGPKPTISGWAAGVKVSVDYSIIGNRHRVWAWVASGTKPTSPLIDVTDTASDARTAGYVGITLVNGSAAAARQMSIDNVNITATLT